MDYTFTYADKTRAECLLPRLFEILDSNMHPMGLCEDYENWFSNVCPALQKPQRQIALMYCGEHIVGYFQYYVNGGTFMMEEIQIDKAHQGKGLFRQFFSWLLPQLPQNTESVEAYAHISNVRSQRILESLGLSRMEDDSDGDFYRYKGKYARLLGKYL